MVERFNRRLGEHLDRRPQLQAHRRFRDHAERDAYLHSFVADYNRTRLRCLGYMPPAKLLAKLAGHNTKAGARSCGHQSGCPECPLSRVSGNWISVVWPFVSSFPRKREPRDFQSHALGPRFRGGDDKAMTGTISQIHTVRFEVSPFA
jgi:hypothetical protein